MIDRVSFNTRNSGLLGALLVAIAGCTQVQPTTPETPQVSIPQPVVDLADPRQNMSTARLRMQDNCYWYAHSNPMETTLVPLRTVEGRPICAN